MDSPIAIGWWTEHSHVVHHGEFFVYVLIALLLLYRPPVTSDKIFQAVRGFVNVHFGDSIGLWLLHLALALILVSDVWSNLQHVRDAANALFTASIAILKLTKAPTPANGPESAGSTAEPPTPPRASGAPASWQASRASAPKQAGES